MHRQAMPQITNPRSIARRQKHAVVTDADRRFVFVVGGVHNPVLHSTSVPRFVGEEKKRGRGSFLMGVVFEVARRREKRRRGSFLGG